MFLDKKNCHYLIYLDGQLLINGENVFLTSQDIDCALEFDFDIKVNQTIDIIEFLLGKMTRRVIFRVKEYTLKTSKFLLNEKNKVTAWNFLERN